MLRESLDLVFRVSNLAGELRYSDSILVRNREGVAARMRVVFVGRYAVEPDIFDVISHVTSEGAEDLPDSRRLFLEKGKPLCGGALGEHYPAIMAASCSVVSTDSAISPLLPTFQFLCALRPGK
jgi:hypothetical protein